MKDHHYHILQVAAANLAALGITFSNAEEWLKVISLSIAIVYSVWKFYTDYTDRQKRGK